MPTGLAYHPSFLNHDTGTHPECAERLTAIREALRQSAVFPRLAQVPCHEATVEDLTRIHSLEYIQRVKAASAQSLPYLDTPDCPVSPGTWPAALRAVGGAVELCRQVLAGTLNNGFLLARPPGHHAERDRAMGFCFFNQVAIAAAWLLHSGLERVLIFDFDVHHGNGTQHAFETSSQVFYASIHQHPATLYPGTGWPEERGLGAGEGYTVNFPLNPGAGDAECLDVFETQLLPLFHNYRPQFVLISAGFDGHREDPLASLNLTQVAYDRMILAMKTLAEKNCAGRLVTVLEGGYNTKVLSHCAKSHVEILADSSPPRGTHF
ncbi:MAG: histone deacetylase [Deltaproteobacteria bacterium]|nr:histone deacetylase [Deltaproteobacteria bacterium]